MVAPAYAAHRSALAKSLGLGRKGAANAVEVDDTAPEVEAQSEPETPKKAGRGGKKAA